MSFVDGEAVKEGYEKVRRDDKKETWMLLKYEEKQIVLCGTGIGYDEFLEQLGDDDRAYGYIRVETGDEMSKRAKFVFVTWIGPNVGALNRAKVSTDKGSVKRIISDFAIEVLADEKAELKLDSIRSKVIAAGGANYGTGK
ncbi:coactosin-like protein [Lytechinus variegatus]|uniref:coactosin-like protein n=1 Tax=Lytechinus variegatus TaxID=7654 RepID=UPI001BB10371|nr:coactosin-like protein [Lytechinus variegatus]